MKQQNSAVADIGVIVGRFQVHELHESHCTVIETVLSRHKKAIVCLGVSPTLVTKRNPLDFVSRKEMLLAKYPNLTVIALPDVRSDEDWSTVLDARIREISPVGSVMLYGSRANFIDRYTGGFPAEELEQHVFMAGTEVRAGISSRVQSSADFRAGVIYAAYNQYPKVFPTVDVAVIKNDAVLLARKPGETLLRFIGGFTDPTDANYEAAARREVKEEVGVEIEKPEYVGSAQIDDWRYGAEEDKIITLLFTARYRSGSIEPQDDIAEARLVRLRDFTPDMLVQEHRILYKMLNAKLMFREEQG